MSDDWSLKGKDFDIADGTLYMNYDIETLREKLIEDIKTVGCISEHHFKNMNPHMVISIINQRFGVKESRVKPDPRLTEYYPIG